MPGLDDDVVDEPVRITRDFSVLRQRVDLDVDFAEQSLKGSTEITIQPLVKELRVVNIHCRQCRPTSVKAGGITAKFDYDDPYRSVRRHANGMASQHEMLKQKIQPSLRPIPEPELQITLPTKLKIQELHVDPIASFTQPNGPASLQRQESDAMIVAETPTIASAPRGPLFAPIKLFIEFEVESFTAGLHWIGFEDGDKRFPYCYTLADRFPGTTSAFVPCVDDHTSRCTWEISIRAPKTLGDAFRCPNDGEFLGQAPHHQGLANGEGVATQGSVLKHTRPTYSIDLSDADAEFELTIVGVGEQTDDVADAEDDRWHTVTFVLEEPVTARHIGFAIGPFEHVELSTSREAEEEERLGQNAVKVDAYCLPGRSQEVRNTCVPITKALDHFSVNFGSFPFSSYQLLFVDDFVHNTVPLAGLSVCSSRLLFDQEIIEPLEANTRELIRALAEQWMGVHVIPQELTDSWAVAGVAGFMADLYGKVIFGNNAYRWQQKLAAEKVYELDVDRPSIHQQGQLLHLDSTIRDFVNLKSALVLFILDRRLMKANGSSGVTRVINRIFLHTKTGSLYNGELSTSDFQRTCEKLGHNKLEAFFRQWVLGAGCPIFFVTQKFNKKKLVVEMTIVQKQLERITKPPFEPSIFIREVQEHVKEVWAPEVPPVFTGPMTIRIHEADGTPYEHIVEIKEATTRLEIPYNTKYKRLKRSRRQKERAMAEGVHGEGGEDSLLYCLGDILDSPEEVKDWNLADWTPEDEEKMGQESYEWIRIDADFEWIGKIHLVMPLYMYISQLQQDRDLVAQYESMRYLLGSNPHHVSLTILIRTLMDHRYFHGIRAMAAEGLAMLSKEKDNTLEIGQFHLEKAFEELFCFPGEAMPRPNDWSDRTRFIIQCAIPRAMSKLRDGKDQVPLRIRKFFIDKLKFNDNSNNEYSDCHYIATLMRCLTDTLVASHRAPEPSYSFSFGEDEPMMEAEDPNELFEKQAIDEIERYRRIDEWITTYQNIYSVTALNCLTKLTKAGLVKDKTKEVLQYTRARNADLVRLEAFKCLTETGLTRKMVMMRYVLQSIADDSSPFFRDRLTRCFGEALGHIALGDAEAEPAKPALPAELDSGLVLEQEVSSEVKQLEVSRKTTPEGALIALKNVIGNDETFKTSLWRATTSRWLSLDETGAFCDIAALLYAPIASCIAIARLPRSYRCEKVGKGLVRFIPHGAYRTVPKKPLALEDWTMLHELRLKYTGPLSSEAKKAIKAAAEEAKTLKLQLPQSRQPSFSLDPNMTPTTGTSTPFGEKSGFKLSLGAKRKQSMDMTPRAGSPKTAKVSHPHNVDGTPSVARSNGAPSLQRRASTSSRSSHVKSRIVKIPVSIMTSSKISTILSGKSGRGLSTKPPTTEPRRSITPSSLSSPYSFGASLTQSPTGGSFLPTNLGGFRSYGTEPTGAMETTSPSIDVKHEIKQESLEVHSPETGGLSPHSRALSTAPSMSPPVVASASGMPPPPKPLKKLTLKLGPRSGPSSGQGSPQ